MMPERFVQDNLPWLYALVLSFWGCAVQYATRLKKGETASLKSFFLDLVICSFAG